MLNKKQLIRTLIVLSTFALVACTSTPPEEKPLEEEVLLERSGNHEKLVEFYKAKLTEKEDRVTRMKLAQAYLDSGDAESALFFISLLNMGAVEQPGSLLVEAKALYELGEFEKAKKQALRAYERNPNNAELENLLGMIHASTSEFSQARHYFTQARTHLYDDIKIKNNLAVLNIIEGHPKKAVQLLLPIYLKGKADEQIEANLTLAMAKVGNISYIKDMSKGEISDQELYERYLALRNSKAAGEFKSGSESNESE
ncbi:tetratricopeptide repeat protein [Vibrio nigripulchritudo]|uniref:tetratricopeptide repeat protein n=1 Tax=Vibrio nigripulchritudo TaxID=28173 RepID=UPI002493B335|nr:hypothetical protein [Vibrio nigripulchritudo]BDU39729.1 hypothetical protein TUMSATVNIG2_41980 [Vibrio nigripulchritudo]BDU45452.1 hypothetical protein TUMSATVNIG3_42500 [Vibrio nigripulchritudo]